MATSSTSSASVRSQSETEESPYGNERRDALSSRHGEIDSFQTASNLTSAGMDDYLADSSAQGLRASRRPRAGTGIYDPVGELLELHDNQRVPASFFAMPLPVGNHTDDVAFDLDLSSVGLPQSEGSAVLGYTNIQGMDSASQTRMEQSIGQEASLKRKRSFDAQYPARTPVAMNRRQQSDREHFEAAFQGLADTRPPGPPLLRSRSTAGATTATKPQAHQGLPVSSSTIDSNLHASLGSTSKRRVLVDLPPTSMLLPARKVFPIQIGSELFRLSGAAISSDGMPSVP